MKAHSSISLLIILLLWSSLGCRPQREMAQNVLTPSYKPQNYQSVEQLPSTTLRLLVLPVYYHGGYQEFTNEVDSIIYQSITASQRFETIPIRRQALQDLFGISQLSASDPLPFDFLTTLKEQYQVDAILLTELTQYDPYKPITVGYRARIFTIDTGQTLWAFDDLFHSGQANISQGAQRFQNQMGRQSYPLNDSYSVLQSPSRFAYYAASTMFTTLPSH